MRHASIPAWTTLREPSSSSVAPSEDELQEHSSQESMARAQGTRLPASTRARPDGAPGASGSRSVSGRGVGGAGPSGTQASGSAAPRYPRPDPSSQARRPLSSDSEEEEEVRRPKKRKKRILDPDKDVLAMAKTRVKIPDAVPPPTQSRRVSHGGETLTAFRNATRGVRRPSGLNIASPDREGENDAASTPVRPAPPASASTPQLPRPSTLKASLLSKTSAHKRRASAPVSPTPREVIEILDSDDEDVPRQPSPKPPPPALPRRKTTQTTKIKKTPAVVFKEVNGVIILDDSDDDIVEQPPPPAQASTSKRKSPLRVSPAPSDASPDAQASTSQRRDASPVRRRSLSVASFVRRPSPAQQTITQESPVLSPERVVSSPIATEQEDVPMLDDGYVPELPEDTMLHAEMPNDASEDLPSPEQVRQEMEEEQTSPVDEVVAHADEPIQAPPSPAQQFSLANSASSPSPQQVPPTREGTAALETASSTLRTASPPEAEPPLQVAAPQPSSLAGATKALISRLSSVALDPAQPDSVREGTASPVSSLLDPRLQDLAITGTPTESSASPAQSSSSDDTHGPPISPKTSRAKMRSPKLASASPAVLRNSEKRRSSSQLASPLSPTSVCISPRSSSSTSRMSPKPSPTLAITSASTPALSVPVQESIEPAAMTPRSNLVEGGTSSEHISIERTSAAETAMDVEEEQPGALKPTAVVVQEVSRESGHSEGCQQGTGVDSAGEQDPAHPGTSVAIADDTEERSGTAPVELGSSRPLGPTLSEIIRKASNHKARENPIDLTEDDDEPVAQPTATVDANVQDLPSAVSTTETPAGPPTEVPQPLPRNIRQRIKLVVQPSPRKDKAPVPLPRNFRRVSAHSGTQTASLSTTSGASQSPKQIPASLEPGPDDVSDGMFRHVRQSPSESPATVGPSPSSPQAPAPLSKSRSQTSAPVALVPDGSFIHVQPRRNVGRPPDSAPPITIRIPPLSRPSSAAASPLGITSQATERVTNNIPVIGRPSVPIISAEQVATPPMSPTEAMDATDEEECLQSLIYPSTTPEDSPEAEMPDEDEHPVRPLSGGWNRGIASSEASSSASGPRRSARLTSGSARSSVEPLDEVEKPRRRLRRRGPIVRTSSEEDVASQGGISRLSGSSKYAKIFEEAGFESISWRRDKGRIAKEFAPIAQLAENIPHELYDQLNSLPPSARRAGNMQVLVFEAEIRANTAEDEPNAPPIRIINDVDDEPTPPLEFFYSNLMWHGKGVPKPDYDALQGCSCSGPCEPSSCACARKHKDYCKGTPSFMYDKKGKVRAIDDELPIFECNMNCGCSDDCPNRVVQHGRQHEIMIKKTPNKGWGIFAGSKKIPAHTYIGVYAGEYLMDADGEARGKIYNKFGRTYLFDVDFWHVKKKTGHEDVRYCIDAYHAGNFTRYLNHSCDPNCAIVAVYINEANVEKPLLAIFTKREIDPGQELCFSYMGNVDDSDIESDSDDDDDDGAPKTFGGGVYVKCQCGAANCCGKMWK